MKPIFERVTGEYGTAHPCAVPDSPWTSDIVGLWLINGIPGMYHPFFYQWLLDVVRVPRPPGAGTDFDGGSTHEFICLTLDPEGSRYEPARFAEDLGSGQLRCLQPANVVVQVVAEDEEVVNVLSLLAQGMVAGVLNPESLWTNGFDKSLNERWSASIEETLEHMRGGVH